MPPAARITDLTTHGSPLAPGPGSMNVMIGGLPAWRAVIDQHACPAVSVTGPDGVGSVVMGSPTVFINGMMACRMGDIVLEKPGLALGPANPIVMGCMTVMIGEVGMGAVVVPDVFPGMAALSGAVAGAAGAAAQSLAASSQSGAGTVPLAGNSALATAVTGSSAAAGSGSEAGSGAGAGSDATKKTWVEIELQGPDGKPVPNEAYRIEAPDGSVHEGSTDERGVARVDGIDPGNCKITFPALDKQAWERK
jgi:uncharacterized Zn-binding protein involved in type VI secretion